MANKSNHHQHPTLTGSEILWATLAGEGVTTVFGYPGGAILPVYDALHAHLKTGLIVRRDGLVPPPAGATGVAARLAYLRAVLNGHPTEHH